MSYSKPTVEPLYGTDWSGEPDGLLVILMPVSIVVPGPVVYVEYDVAVEVGYITE